jgi:radical SAM-linked protein
VIKLYFMVGLPTETNDDLEALVDLVKSLRRIKGANGRRGKINVSVATFIPKPHTPFQWASQISLAESQKRIGWVKDRLKLPGIQFKWQDPKVSLLEGVWARGDRRLSRLLETAYRKGCRFDGWSDQFNFSLWQEAFVEAGVDVDFYTTRLRDVCEPLPWDSIDTRITKEFLAAEWDNATNLAFTPDCRMGECNSCGVCDFSEIEPKTFEGFRNECAPVAPAKTNALDAVYKKLHIVYAKQGPAKYFGHLEMVNILLRAFKRAGIPLKFTEGFHPKPKVSFDDPLPVGMESEAENFTVTVPVQVDTTHLAATVNSNLPNGLFILDCTTATTGLDRSPRKRHTFKIVLESKTFAGQELAAFIENPDVIITRTNRKGTLKNINLKDMVENIELLNPTRLHLTLISEPGKTIRPADVLRKIFSLTEEEIKQAKITKQRAQRA